MEEVTQTANLKHSVAPEHFDYILGVKDALIDPDFFKTERFSAILPRAKELFNSLAAKDPVGPDADDIVCSHPISRREKGKAAPKKAPAVVDLIGSQPDKSERRSPASSIAEAVAEMAKNLAALSAQVTLLSQRSLVPDPREDADAQRRAAERAAADGAAAEQRAAEQRAAEQREAEQRDAPEDDAEEDAGDADASSGTRGGSEDIDAMVRELTAAAMSIARTDPCDELALERLFDLPSDSTPLGRETTEQRNAALAKAEPLISATFAELLAKSAQGGVRTKATKEFMRRLHEHARADISDTDTSAATTLLRSYAPIFSRLSTKNWKPLSAHVLQSDFSYSATAAAAIAGSLAQRA